MKEKIKQLIIVLGIVFIMNWVLKRVLHHAIQFFIDKRIGYSFWMYLYQRNILDDCSDMIYYGIAILILVAIYGIFKVTKKDNKNCKKSFRNRCIWLTTCIISGLILPLLINAVISLLPIEEQLSYQDSTGIISNIFPNEIWLFLLIHVIMVPIYEELLYRGVVYSKLRDVWSVIGAIIISAGLFAIAHHNIIQCSYAFLLGIFLCVIRDRTCSVYYTIAFHIAFNFMGSGLIQSMLIK